MSRVTILGIMAAAWAGVVGVSLAGNLEPSAAPTSAGSAMYTLNDLYNRLTTGATTNLRTGAFQEPAGGPTNGTMHTVNEIYALPLSPVPKTMQTKSYNDGGLVGTPVVPDDGVMQKGFPMPNPRFSLESASGPGTNCVVDNLTGLVWTRDANVGLALGGIYTSSPNGADGKQGTSWVGSFNCITNGTTGLNGINYGGHNDWRMPNVKELYSLIAIGDWCGQSGTGPALTDASGTNKWTEGNLFRGVKSLGYWSSTTRPGANAYYAYGVEFASGMIAEYGIKWNYSAYVWAVRGPR